MPANGLGGSRATKKRKLKAPQKNRAKPEKQKGKKEGGLGEGIFALLRLKIERFRFSLIKRNTKQKNFLFLLKEKIAREKIKKCRENFSVLVCRSGAEASENALHYSGFCSKKVRISTKRYRQFTISEFSEVLRTCGAVASPAGEAERVDFERICHAPRGEKETAWFWIWKFVLAEPKQNKVLQPIFFCFAFGETWKR